MNSLSEDSLLLTSDLIDPTAIAETSSSSSASSSSYSSSSSSLTQAD
jgi:hypothetical protein